MAQEKKNTLEESGQKSVRINDNDVKIAEELGLAGISASTTFSNLLQDRKVLAEKRREKRKELEKEVVSIKQQAKEWGIDPHNIGLLTNE